jgi:hypothetical protein
MFSGTSVPPEVNCHEEYIRDQRIYIVDADQKRQMDHGFHQYSPGGQAMKPMMSALRDTSTHRK